ncbi:cardiolipin synthase [Labedella gwakjiensis]|uniref:CDP-alcohol phosphatidyltransferase family protein n=1 Tax=Labedella gwakjiensis TaxID=390269 RepID=A0A2P8GZH0_9MICO|nr:CDP-alcohol phosphatidyltransferase family protein [Labedella gwakjiensis]PSL39350.1 cardiolipin synthase [Labedella gwakjiensis]RUQ86233.1 CDP-alcohol phosphatidyltransferase family protein [Labedella gwakjiensis]
MAPSEPPVPSDRILTIPNLLSFLRLALVPVFLLFLIDGQDIAALIVLAVSGFTDFLDGFIARRFDQVTRLGQLLDPAADRLYILAAVLGLVMRELIPLWFVVAILARDILLVVVAIVLVGAGHGALPVNRVGKLATACLFVGLPVLMLAAAVPAISPVAQPVGTVIAVIGAILYWVAGLVYLRDTVRIRRQSRSGGGSSSDTLDI